MTFEQLCEIGRKARERRMTSFNFKRGNPLRGKFGTHYQDELLAGGLARYIVSHGPIVVEGITIGLSPACSNTAGIRATNNVKFAGLIRRLREAVMQDFEREIIERWEKFKISRGDFVPRDAQSEADKFSHQLWRGFD